MPLESKAQNRAMHAAAAGDSTLGIPAKVGAEFISAVPKGSVKALPERVNKMRKRGVISDAALAKVRGFAEGGRPPPGKPSVVGEKGPELFVPDKPGTVVPKSLLGSVLRTIAPRNPKETEADRAKQGRSVIGNTLRAVAPRKSRFGQDEVQDVDASSR